MTPPPKHPEKPKVTPPVAAPAPVPAPVPPPIQPIPPIAAVAEMTWDEAEAVMRQLEKELEAAKKAHLALRKAREADESITTEVKTLFSEQTRLTKEIAELRVVLAQEQTDATAARVKLTTERAAEEAQHVETLATRQREIAALTSATDAATEAVRKAKTDRERILSELDRDEKARRDHAKREHALMMDRLRVEIEAAETERRRVETALRDLKTKVASLV